MQYEILLTGCKTEDIHGHKQNWHITIFFFFQNGIQPTSHQQEQSLWLSPMYWLVRSIFQVLTAILDLPLPCITSTRLSSWSYVQSRWSTACTCTIMFILKKQYDQLLVRQSICKVKHQSSKNMWTYASINSSYKLCQELIYAKYILSS